MARVTLVFAVLSAGLGLGAYLGIGSLNSAALVPVGFGIVFGVFGVLALGPNEGRRRLFMHLNVLIALLGFAGSIAEILRGLTSAKEVDLTALAVQLVLAWLLLIYIILCVRSFLAARESAVIAMRREKE
jgi:hypothetical protein